MTANELVAHLDGVTGTKDGWMARCPAHDDRNPSLHVSEGRGKVLVHCHAGCSQEAVVSALGIQFPDLFDTPAANRGPRDAKREITAYDYVDERGELLYQVVRFIPKDFRQRRPDGNGGWRWTLGNTRRVLYRLPAVLEATLQGRAIYVVEGEKDVHAIERLGGVATCCPMGAGKWRAEFSEVLRGARVRIIADADRPGRKHAAEVGRALDGIADSVRLLRAAEGNDAHDHAEAGHGLEKFVPLDRAAAGVTRPTFHTLAELLKRPGLLKPPECVLPRIAFRARGVLLCGPDKSGKSTLLANGAAAITYGRPWLGSETKAGRVVWCGLEEATSDAVRRFAELKAIPDRLQILTLADRELLESTDDLLSEWPADLWVIDSLQEYARVTCGVTPADGDNGLWGTVIRPLISLARKHEAALVMLHHVRRSDGEGRGATEIFAAVDATLTLRMPRNGDHPTTRSIEGRGRWPIERFRVRLTDGRYELAGCTEPSIDANVLLHVQRNPGASNNSIRNAVRGRGTAVDAGITRLATDGAIENRGSDGRPQWHIASGQLDWEGP